MRYSVVSVIVLVLYLGLQANEALHSILQPHYLCSQHGELTHTQHKHSGDQGFATVAVFDKNEFGVHGDKHCHILVERKRETLVCDIGSTICAQLISAHLPTPFVLTWWLTPIEPVYRMAPKTSPPQFS